MTNQESYIDLRCIGCGAFLQTDHPKERGYTPNSAYQKGLETGDLYCQRCFKLRHYNTLDKVQMTAQEFLMSLNQLAEKDVLIVNVVDVFDLAGSLLPGLQRFAGNNPIVFVANKVDLLPSSVKENKLIAWMKRYLKSQGIKVAGIFLTSAKKYRQMDELLDFINAHRKGRDVYVIGVTNVGKSTLINSLLKSRGLEGDVITTSYFPGTTLDVIEIPLDDHSKLLDTPGVIQEGQMTSLLEAKALAQVLPKKMVKPRTYQLNPGQTLFLGGLARFDFEGMKRSGVTVYLSNALDIHRRKTEGADAFYQKHLGSLLTPPMGRQADWPELRRHAFTLKEAQDIAIAGLGWIYCPADSRVAVYVPKGIDVILRQPLI